MSNDTPHESAATASVEHGARIELFNTDGRSSILVPEEDIERWLAEGWSREPFDVTERVAEALLQFNVARDLFSDSVKAIEADGEINPEDERQWSTFESSFAELAHSVATIRLALFQSYPRRESVPVFLVNEALAEDDPKRAITVDPNQVEVYVAEGYVSA